MRIISERLTGERRHSRLIGPRQRELLRIDIRARKWHALFIAARLYVIGEFGGEYLFHVC